MVAWWLALTHHHPHTPPPSHTTTLHHGKHVSKQQNKQVYLVFLLPGSHVGSIPLSPCPPGHRLPSAQLCSTPLLAVQCTALDTVHCSTTSLWISRVVSAHWLDLVVRVLLIGKQFFFKLNVLIIKLRLNYGNKLSNSFHSSI